MGSIPWVWGFIFFILGTFLGGKVMSVIGIGSKS